jgi:hypothetical protein
MKALGSVTLLLTLALPLSTANADRVNLTVVDNPSAVSTAPLDFWVNVTEIHNAANNRDLFRFAFRNDSAAASSITHINFESGLFSAFKPGGKVSQKGTAGVKFAISSKPAASIAVGNTLGWGGAGLNLMAKWNGGKKANGLNAPGETLFVKVEKAAGFALGDLLSLINSTGRIAVYAQGLGDGASKVTALSGVPQLPGGNDQPRVTPAPLPAAVWAGMAMLGGLGVFRRFGKRTELA